MNPSELPDCLRTESGRTALRWIEDERLALGGLLLSPHTWDEDFLTLLRRCRTLRPGTPIHLLLEGEAASASPLSEPPTQAALGITGVLDSGSLSAFLGNRTAPTSRTPGAMRMTLVQERGFIGVPLLDFEGCEHLLFDLHVKIGDGKFLRLIDASETGAWERIRKYVERGVTHLYVSREAHERSLMAIRLFQNALPAKGGDSTDSWSELRVAHALREVSQLLSRLTSIEQVDPSLWDSSRELILQFRSAVFPRKESGAPISIDTWLRRSLFLDHSLSVFVMATLVGRHLQFSREDSFLKLAMASLFHDIALLDFPALPREERPEALPHSEREKFLKHPMEGANHLELALQADPLVVQAVRSHHWRRDGSSGFSQGTGRSAVVPRLGEVIGIAEEVTQFALRNPKLDSRSLSRELAPRLAPKFSREVLAGLQSALSSPEG